MSRKGTNDLTTHAERIPVVGKDFTVAYPDEPSLQDRYEKITWWNLPPEERLRQSYETWKQWNEAKQSSPRRALQSLRRALGSVK